MAALARAVAGLLVRGGWLTGLLVVETLLLAGFWASGALAFEGAFDRRAAEADLLLLTLSSLPALVVGALVAAGDREDGMADFFLSCRVGPGRQVGGQALGLVAVLGGALGASVVVSLAVTAPAALGQPGLWTTLVLGVMSTAVHAAWGLALGSAVRSRLFGVALALLFWVVTVFAAEALVTTLVSGLPLRWGYPTLVAFLALDPSQLFRVTTVVVRGQGWSYGPVFQELFKTMATPGGLAGLAAVVVVHLALPLALAVGFRRAR